MLKDFPIAPIMPAKDLERAKAFYQEKLGLNLAPGMDMPGLIVFECGNGTMLVLYEKKEYPESEITQAGFNVTDIENLVKELSEKGVAFEQYDIPDMQLKTDENGIATVGPIKTAWFKDSEGNILALNQM